MEETVIYTYGGGLYVNMTNRCPCKCNFCVRQMTDGLGGADSLWLEKEPTVDQVINELKKWPLADYEEVIFCGYGEPTVRLDDVLEVCRYLKENHVKTRINTNGLADLIHSKETLPMLKGLVDSLSISLNEADAKSYEDLCHPVFGKGSYDAVLKYIRDSRGYVNHVAVSVVGCIPMGHIEKCRTIAEEYGVDFKVR